MSALVSRGRQLNGESSRHIPCAARKSEVTAHGMCLRLSKVSPIGLAQPRSPRKLITYREKDTGVRGTRENLRHENLRKHQGQRDTDAKARYFQAHASYRANQTGA